MFIIKSECKHTCRNISVTIFLGILPRMSNSRRELQSALLLIGQIFDALENQYCDLLNNCA